MGALNDANFNWTASSGHEYGFYKLNKTWAEAKAFASALGGYLVKIDDAAENQDVFNRIINYLNISDLSQTTAEDGGGSPYVWLGANDASSEGVWRWDFDGSLISLKSIFWGSGALGREPDNDLNQDYLALGLKNWPDGSPDGEGFGNAGSWNDISVDNRLFFVIEKNPLSISTKPIANAINSTEGKIFSYSLPKGTFTDSDKGDVLTYQCDNLPSWLKINSVNGKLTGNPDYLAADSSPLSLNITATDKKGESASISLTLNIQNTSNIKGTGKADTLVAGQGDDVISGLNGNDVIQGGDGNDTMNGGFGTDTITGGAGNDIFIFNTSLEKNKFDLITDFAGEDRIFLEDKIFKAFKDDPFVENHFSLGNQANSSTNYLFYDTETGGLFYDADGNGIKTSAIKIATIGLETHPELIASQIEII